MTPKNHFESVSNQNELPCVLEEERRIGYLDTKEINYYLEGSKEISEKIQLMMMQFERDPTFRMDDMPDQSKDAVRERVMKRAQILTKYVSEETPEDFRLRFRVLSLIDPGFMTRMGVHYALFMGAISGSGTPEQQDFWLKKGAMTFHGLIGCYGMTEMGHGSNVACLETTATFDQATDEFIIHTPTLTATKWWIGGAAQSATHSAVFARLIVDGKDYGVKSFIVPLRNLSNFSLMPGINIGDMGMKMGRNAIDNGWIQFTNVRIPRSNMLMRYTQVSRDGVVSEPPLKQLAYGALIYGRMAMIRESCDALKKALTIAVRYSCNRRQFSSSSESPERKIMDYMTHQNRLLPLLAVTYALNFAGRAVNDSFDKNMATLQGAKSTDPSIKIVLDSLKETHGTTAGLKAFSTWLAVDGIEKCRQCLGGNGYSSYSALPGMAQDFAVQCTWEGDNTVLTLQTGRYLLTCYKEWKNGGKLTDGVNYLNKLPEILYKKCTGDPCDLEEIKIAFDVLRAYLVQKIYEDYSEAIKHGEKDEEALNACSLSRTTASKFHCLGILFEKFFDAVKKAPSTFSFILIDLCLLYGLHTIKENSGEFIMCGYFTSIHLKKISEAKIRPYAVALTDAFHLSDYVVNTPLGHYSGNVNEKFFTLIKTLNPQKEHPYFDRTLKPFLNREKSVPEPGPKISF